MCCLMSQVDGGRNGGQMINYEPPLKDRVYVAVPGSFPKNENHSSTFPAGRFTFLLAHVLPFSLPETIVELIFTNTIPTPPPPLDLQVEFTTGSKLLPA